MHTPTCTSNFCLRIIGLASFLPVLLHDKSSLVPAQVVRGRCSCYRNPPLSDTNHLASPKTSLEVDTGLVHGTKVVEDRGPRHALSFADLQALSSPTTKRPVSTARDRHEHTEENKDTQPELTRTSSGTVVGGSSVQDKRIAPQGEGKVAAVQERPQKQVSISAVVVRPVLSRDALADEHVSSANISYKVGWFGGVLLVFSWICLRVVVSSIFVSCSYMVQSLSLDVNDI